MGTIDAALRPESYRVRRPPCLLRVRAILAVPVRAPQPGLGLPREAGARPCATRCSRRPQVDLNVTVDAHAIAQAAIGFVDDGAQSPSCARLDLLEHIDPCSGPGIVHRSRHERDCGSFSEFAQKSAVQWTPRWTPKLSFCGHHDGHHGGKSLKGKMLAEREGFEPPIELPLCLISSQVHSTGLCHLSAL